MSRILFAALVLALGEKMYSRRCSWHSPCTTVHAITLQFTLGASRIFHIVSLLHLAGVCFCTDHVWMELFLLQQRRLCVFCGPGAARPSHDGSLYWNVGVHFKYDY